MDAPESQPASASESPPGSLPGRIYLLATTGPGTTGPELVEQQLESAGVIRRTRHRALGLVPRYAIELLDDGPATETQARSPASCGTDRPSMRSAAPMPPW
jgi:hypothetical protein